jgi:dGTPase
LQAKTQVLGVGEGDFHRTRLTHSLEAAQIGQGIVRSLDHPDIGSPEGRQLLPPPLLVEAMSLAHDLGHPPFGHGGEVALNWCMRSHGGFEGNGQTLRLLALLEAYESNHGLDLCRRTLLGVLKYPVPYKEVSAHIVGTNELPYRRAANWKPPKCFHNEEREIVSWILDPFELADRDLFQKASTPHMGQLREDGRPLHGKPLHKAFDTSIMELADDIAYGVHDLEDAIALHLIGREKFMEVYKAHEKAISGLRGNLPEAEIEKLFTGSSARKKAIGGLVNIFIVNIRLEKRGVFQHLLLDYQATLPSEARGFLDALMTLVAKQVVKQPSVQMPESRGQRIVQRIFEAIADDPERFLKDSFLSSWNEKKGDTTAQMRVVCDYIAGMTDEYATKVYELLFVPRTGNSFERL